MALHTRVETMIAHTTTIAARQDTLATGRTSFTVDAAGINALPVRSTTTTPHSSELRGTAYPLAESVPLRRKRML